MASHNDALDCPRCDGTNALSVNYDTREGESGECYECGYVYYPKHEVMTLKEVNEYRENMELEPLEKLVEGNKVFDEMRNIVAVT